MAKTTAETLYGNRADVESAQISSVGEIPPSKKTLGAAAYLRGWGNGEGDIYGGDPTSKLTGPAGKYNSSHWWTSPRGKL